MYRELDFTLKNYDEESDEIKLAIDLIQLIELNEIKKETAVKALEIALNDFNKKENNE